MARNTWLDDEPPDAITIGDLTLERLSPARLEELVDAVNSSLDELRPWMPWAQTPATAASIGEFLERADAGWAARTEFQFGMVVGRPGARGWLWGCCGLHDRVGAGGLEIGYWVRTDVAGQGLATAAAGELARTALGLDGVGRVEIHCDETNVRSAAVPPKLGFRLDRVDDRPPEAPGERGRRMIWVRTREDPTPLHLPWRPSR
jgi:RimJ/RimL family protein N-acetyltransferase